MQGAVPSDTLITFRVINTGLSGVASFEPFPETKKIRAGTVIVS
jgi:hypothetical protein